MAGDLELDGLEDPFQPKPFYDSMILQVLFPPMPLQFRTNHSR